jgi:hypothetical protein
MKELDITLSGGSVVGWIAMCEESTTPSNVGI